MTCKCLLDECVDHRLAEHLAMQGHNVTIIGRDYPSSLPDSEGLALALQELRILIIFDRDFGELVITQGRPNQGVVLLRLKEVPFAAKAARLDHVLTAHVANLGRFLVVTEFTVRIR